MATTKTLPAAPQTEQWGDKSVPVLGGQDLIDKAELLGRRFMITGLKPEIGARDIAYIYVEGEFEPGGERFQFNDSSKGVKAQLDSYMKNYIPDGTKPDDHGWFDVEILAPRGLRVSEFEVQDERGKQKMAKTYYITTSGSRA